MFGKLLRASTTKPLMKVSGGQVNSLVYGNNVEDWTIRG